MDKEKRIEQLKQDLKKLKEHLDFIIQHGIINSKVGLEIQRIEQQIRELESGRYA
jgi:chromosome segregation ATPase